MTAFEVPIADRLRRLPPYLFAQLDRMKAEALRKGMDVINLGIGDPDLPTPEPIVERLAEAARKPANHQYPSYEGSLAFREAVAAWYHKAHGVHLDPEKEILSLIGSKEGVGHVPLAFINPGDPVLIPDPGYPVYHAGTLFALGEPYFMPLSPGRGFLPDLAAIDAHTRSRARLMFLNYPNNPTAAVATRDFFHEVVAFAREYGVIVCHDGAYSQVVFDGGQPLSFLSVEGAKEVGVEFHSLSKTYNMTGWRVGFVAGNADVVQGLGRVKTNLDSGVFGAVQEAAIFALTTDQSITEPTMKAYGQRRDLAISLLRKMGIAIEPPRATFYIWFPVPGGGSSTEFAARLLTETGVVLTPGLGFGAHGEGYLRMTLCTPAERLAEALNRMQKLLCP